VYKVQRFQVLVMFLLGRSNLKNAAANSLSRLLDSLHLLANAGPCRLIAAFRFVNVGLNLSNQHFKVFVLLHQKQASTLWIKIASHSLKSVKT